MNENLNPARLIDELERDGASRLVIGVPDAGKTEYALQVMLEGLRRYGASRVVMTVSSRVVADSLGNRVIRELGASDQVRPVTTIGAVAFRVIASSRAAQGLPAPRLLNGAEQDALLRRVLAVHVGHAVAGDDCGTCALLRDYFAQAQWASLVVDDHGAVSGGSTSADVFTQGISDTFVSQLRDMLARLDELGVGPHEEPALVDAVAADGRLTVQWRLAFALRREYIEAQRQAYPGQYRVDASYLLVDGAREIRGIRALHVRQGAMDIPRLVVVDDVQDITLAGLRFLEELHQSGVSIVLIGNPDEAVQTFRGSYPEYVIRRAVTGPLQAVVLPLQRDVAPDRHEGYADVVASRVSLSIPSEEEEELPLSRRPGKLLAALRVASQTGLEHDGTVQTGLYRSAREELDDVIWRIKRAHLDRRVRWNDMAVIAHDNATVRSFGERLRRDGVPVRYSSVTRPLKDESFIQGLFAFIELAYLRMEGMSGRDGRNGWRGMALTRMAAYVRARVNTIMNSPLVTTGTRPGQGGPARLAPVESAMDALESLAPVADQDAMLSELVHGWESLMSMMPEVSRQGQDESETLSAGISDSTARRSDSMTAESDAVEDAGQTAESGQPLIQVDDALVEDGAVSQDELGFGSDALFVMLALDDESAPAASVLAAIDAVLGGNPQSRAFSRVWRMVATICAQLRALPYDQRENPGNVLSIAWNAVEVASAWQSTALLNTADGRVANDRLDAAMRLFQFATDSSASATIRGFMTQVRTMQVQADSLAHLGPVEDAVTLATPAGASGRHWPYVWIPALQEGIWPNLAGRNTMFGGEELVELVLRGALAAADGTGHDPRFVTVLSGEKKSFLVALTRATRQVTVSAVWNDKSSPSDFLFGYLPEMYSRDKEQSRFTEVGNRQDGVESDAWFGLDGDPRGLVAIARVTLSSAAEDSDELNDAAAALGILAAHGIAAAHPDDWPFVRQCSTPDVTPSIYGNTDDPTSASDHDQDDHANQHADGRLRSPDDDAPVVTLSPSAVDGLWACPVCWMLEHQFAGPQPGSVNAGFGTLIHAVAQQGSEERLDHLHDDDEVLRGLGLNASSTSEQRVQAVAERLVEIYRGKRPDPDAIADVQERYRAIRKDDSASDMLKHIASYFVQGAENAYLEKNSSKFSIGTLVQADCELPFSARFGFDDILAAYNAVPGVHAVDRDTLIAMMGELVGGWPEGVDENMTVRLSGRIDRMETRRLADGREIKRLIDYKTGAVPVGKQIFNDLQLVCYQLGLVFPEGGPRGAAALRKAPRIEQSELFHVAKNMAPAQSFAPEGMFQPPLFTEGSLNTEPFTVRYHYASPSAWYDMPVLCAEQRPEHVGEAAWEQCMSLNGTQAIWSLTMIARVFYAAAASRSMRLDAHPQSEHVRFCRMGNVCPACARQVDTVFETRQA